MSVKKQRDGQFWNQGYLGGVLQLQWLIAAAVAAQQEIAGVTGPDRAAGILSTKHKVGHNHPPL